MIYSLDHMSSKLIELIYKLDDNDRKAFVHTPVKSLYKFNDTLGKDIREMFYLDSSGWEPIIVNGVDVADDAPANVSLRIIENAHKQMNQPH